MEICLKYKSKEKTLSLILDQYLYRGCFINILSLKGTWVCWS